MARKTIFVSDLTGKTIEEKDAATVTIRYADARKDQVVLDVNASEVVDLASKGTRQARRGSVRSLPTSWSCTRPHPTSWYVRHEAKLASKALSRWFEPSTAHSPDVTVTTEVPCKSTHGRCTDRSARETGHRTRQGLPPSGESTLAHASVSSSPRESVFRLPVCLERVELILQNTRR
jgi:hypothetical protein